MTASTETASTAASTDIDVVRAVFGAFATGDLAALSDLLHADAGRRVRTERIKWHKPLTAGNASDVIRTTKAAGHDAGRCG